MWKKWHPDRWLKDQVAAGQAKRQFQQIQEAYSGPGITQNKKETVRFSNFFS